MMSTPNPLLQESTLDFRLPPFDRISDEHFLPAFEAGLAEHTDEIERIAAAGEPPTFENTLVALERSGSLLERVSTVFFNLTSAHTNPALQHVQSTMAPRLAAHSDSIHLDPRLFSRIAELYANREELDLTEEQAWLLERYHLQFVRAGAELSAEQQDELRALNAELATASTEFQENLLADTNDLAVVVDDPAELAGMSDDAVAAAVESAKARGLDGKSVLTLNLPTQQAPLSSLTNRALRERLLSASLSRGSRGNEHDNTALAAKLARLRARRAALLGYSTHAAYKIADQTAKTAEAARGLLTRLAPAAVANAQAEAADLQEHIDTQGEGIELRAWDWEFYAERVRSARYSLDAADLRPYFELERVLVDGVFHAATELYGLGFTERFDLPTYHPDVRVFEVADVDGSACGLFLVDYFARPSKRGGAWMNTFVDQSRLRGTLPVVVNVLNIAKPPAGEPALLTFDEVTTAFHEFGHALHALFSDVTYPKFSGTSVPRDFVEFPSQVNEMWATWPEVLANYARHHRTGEPLPASWVESLQAAQRYGEGFATTEYLAASLLDLAWHELGVDDEVDDVTEFESAALEKAGVLVPGIPPRYRSTYFAHVFSGGYDAGYYSYIWSQVLDADTVEWFKENGGLLRANGDEFRRAVLSKGGSLDVMAAFRAFRGRDPEIEPLLQRKGLTGA